MVSPDGSSGIILAIVAPIEFDIFKTIRLEIGCNPIRVSDNVLFLHLDVVTCPTAPYAGAS